MISINPESREDPFYRYKMPVVKTTILGQNSNFETRILNLDEIGLALHRVPDTIFKNITDVANTAGVLKKTWYILKGKYTTEQIQIAIDQYVKQYVLCKSCSNPETHLDTDKKNLFMKCDSCGQSNVCDATTKTGKRIINSIQN